METMQLIKTYLSKLARHAINIFSGISLLLGILAVVLLPLNSTYNAIILTGSAFLSILIASFFVWREELQKHPSEAKLSITHTFHRFGADVSQAGIPKSDVKFTIGLDAINHGKQIAVLRSIEVTKFEMNTDILGKKPTKTQLLLTNHPHESRQIYGPYNIEGNKRLPNLEYQIWTSFEPGERKEFARRLAEFRNYVLELQYTYEDMSRTSHTDSIRIEGSFKEFRDGRINDWKNNPALHELALIALDSLNTLPE
jgi:hypothetical protein